MTELKYPGWNDDWSPVYSIVRESVEKWVGRERLEEKLVRDGGDNSLLPVAKYDRNEATLCWEGEDKFSELLGSPNGQTRATYISGHGLTCEYVYSELQSAVHDKIYRLCEAKNPSLDEDEQAYWQVWDWCNEEAQAVLGDYDNSTLNNVIEDCKEREKEDATVW
jgi:hypothetical protein